jgi:hypothetical protein
MVQVFPLQMELAELTIWTRVMAEGPPLRVVPEAVVEDAEVLPTLSLAVT